jgi:hypothetical protein
MDRERERGRRVSQDDLLGGGIDAEALHSRPAVLVLAQRPKAHRDLDDFGSVVLHIAGVGIGTDTPPGRLVLVVVVVSVSCSWGGIERGHFAALSPCLRDFIPLPLAPAGNDGVHGAVCPLNQRIGCLSSPAALLFPG